jgi:hypothetical protein
MRIIVSNSFAGADFILDNSNSANMGRYPSAALGADIMPWLDEKTQTCTVAYWHQRLQKEQCTSPELQEQKQLCNWHQRMSQDNDIVGVFLETAALSETANNMTSCHSPTPGFKIQADWLDDMTDKNYWLSYSRLRGAKMIRLKRSSLERYLSLTIRVATGIWHTPDVETKRQQLDKFRGNNIDIGDMLWHLDRSKVLDAVADAFVEEYASEILHVDYSDLRSRPDRAWDLVHEFWEVVDGSIPDSNVSQWNDATRLLQYVNNRDVVEEALGANGRGHEIDKKYNQLQHIIIIEKGAAFRRADSVPGVNTTIVSNDSEILDNLQEIDGDAFVVISGPGLSLNPHIRKHSDFYQKLVDFRAILSDMAQDGSVVVLPTPGTQDREIANPSRLRRSLWKSSMTVLHDHVAVAGRAVDLLAVFEPWQSTISKFLPRHRTPNVVYDLDRKIFGIRFEGVQARMPQCKSDRIDHTSRDTLFVYGDSVDKDCHDATRRSYPIWGSKRLSIQPILHQIDQLLLHDRNLQGINLHFGSEILYLFGRDGVWGSAVKRDIYRVQPTESLIRLAYDEFMKVPARWPRLQKAIQHGAGFPYFGWYGDWKGCNFQNAHNNESVPFITTCARFDCEYAFPSPAYMTIVGAQNDTSSWFRIFRDWDRRFPWDEKISKVVWRGGLTEADPSKVFDSPRWRLTKLVHELNHSKALFDVGFTHIPVFLSANMDIDTSLVGGLVNGIDPMIEFMKYKVIMDMDGNSWSARFSQLLCFNSVVVKVQPQYEDYFYPDLVPWKHYVPVRFDLSDLVESMAYILDPQNDNIAREIIAAANQWCTERLTRTALAHDQLDIYESYVDLLGRSDPEWNIKWSAKKDEIFNFPAYEAPKNGFEKIR